MHNNYFHHPFLHWRRNVTEEMEESYVCDIKPHAGSAHRRVWQRRPTIDSTKVEGFPEPLARLIHFPASEKQLNAARIAQVQSQD